MRARLLQVTSWLVLAGALLIPDARAADEAPAPVADDAATAVPSAAEDSAPPAPGATAIEPPPDAPPLEVRVERVKPKRDKLPTLRFLKENRAFIRARLDLLKQQPIERSGDAAPIDPRFLAYAKMLDEIHAARDSAGAAEDARARRELFASVTELGELETQLDQMERLLAEQRARLDVLQANFTGDQRTALMVVVRGYPAQGEISEVAITLEDGETLRAPLGLEQRESLRRGGIVEVFHGLAEPREQVVTVTLVGAAWPAGDIGYLTLDVTRGRLSLLQLDLSTVEPAQGGASVKASTWLHDAGRRSVDG